VILLHLFHPHSPHKELLPIPLFNAIDRLVEADHLLRVFVELNLVVAGDEPGEADAQQADQEAAVVEFGEDLPGGVEEDMVGVGIVDAFLPGDGVEVGIPELDGDGAGEPVLVAELEADGFGHTDEFGMEEAHVDGVGLEGVLRGDGLLLVIGYDGGFIQAVGLPPEVDPVLAEQGLHHLDRDGGEDLDGLHPAADELAGGLLADAGELADLQGGEVALFFAEGDLQLAVGFDFVGGDLAKELVAGEGVGNGEAAFL